jgi:glyceraldehyde 3-phosphate dehydrogenase
VPTSDVSVVDLTVELNKEAAYKDICAAMKAAAEGPMKGVLDYTDQPLVSSDFNHFPASSTVDSLETAVLESKLARVVSWYDNEWGFSNRMVDTAAQMGRFL